MKCAAPLVDIVILNWNGCRDTLACLASLRRLTYSNFHTIVVDNGSTDGSACEIRSAFPDVELIETGQNLGFAGGNNVGIRRALERQSDYALLLNNDTEVDPKLIDAFVAAARNNTDAGVFSGKIYYHSEPERIWYFGTKWNPNTTHFDHPGHGVIDDGIGFSGISDTDYASGCAFFFSTARAQDVGLLDEDFFLYFEETDWCYRARAKGYRSVVVPEAKLWHKVSASTGGVDSPLMIYFMTRNKLLWAKKHLNRRMQNKILGSILRKLWRPVFLSPNAQAGIPLLKMYYWTARAMLKAIKHSATNTQSIAVLYALRDFYLGRFGDCPLAVRTLRKA